MTFTDWIIDIVLIALVLRQIREARFDLKTVLLPLGAAAWIGTSYLDGIPTSGNDLALVVGFTTIGLVLGTVSALATRVRTDGGRFALVRAGWLAAAMWIAGMGFRFAFMVWASHGGAPALTRFSAAHHITSGNAWTAALVLMALAEVGARTGLLVVRSYRALRVQQPALELVTA